MGRHTGREPPRPRKDRGHECVRPRARQSPTRATSRAVIADCHQHQLGSNGHTQAYSGRQLHLPLSGTRIGANAFADPHADASLSASAVVVARRFAAHSSRSGLR